MSDLYPPYNVKPRIRSYKKLPVVVLTHPPATHWIHESGETGWMHEINSLLPFYKSTLFVMEGSADFLSELDENWRRMEPKRWQWRVAESERSIYKGNVQVAARVTTTVHYFGFKGGNYFKIIDPITMYGCSLDKIWPGDEPAQVRLLRWGIALRDFCDMNNMEVRPTIGGLSSQFLTDARFYPKPRRKVPAKINERAREHQPGNFYKLMVHPSAKKEYTAWYIDQTRAHHYHARTVALPNSDSLYAYGNFQTLETICWRHIDVRFHGLLCVDIDAPKQTTALHWLSSSERTFIFTNEIPHLFDLGYTIRGVRAAWGSYSQDTGLARYATWAEKQLDIFDNAPWLKPLLLATYGALATRPTLGETVFRLCKSGQPVTLVTGNKRLRGKLVSRKVKLEPGIANVIHRGMIEAATRSDSIGLAQWLQSQGFTPLSIYADAVIVKKEETPLPPLPEPWRVKEVLNHLQFINQQAFISGEMTKLPGVSRDILRHSQGAFKHAPRKIVYEMPSGKPIKTGRRI